MRKERLRGLTEGMEGWRMDGWSWDGLTDLTLSPSSRGLLSTDGVLERTLNETFATAVVVEAASERSSERERERDGPSLEGGKE